MRILFDFTPDDGPVQTIEVLDSSPQTLAALRRPPVNDDSTLHIRCRPLGSFMQPRTLLFRHHRISDVREAL